MTVKGFKDTTKTVWLAGGYAKGGRVNGAAKVRGIARQSAALKNFKLGRFFNSK